MSAPAAKAAAMTARREVLLMKVVVIS